MTGENVTPQTFEDDPAELEAFSLAVQAVPWTFRIELVADDYHGDLRAHVRLAQTTFQSGGVYHPLSALTRFSVGSSSWPPAQLEAAVFEPDVGLTILHGQGEGVSAFRALVKVIDMPRGAKRSNNQNELRAIRNVTCLLAAGKGEPKTYQVVMSGELHVVSRLLLVAKDSVLHVVLSQRAGVLNVVAFWEVPSDQAETFKKFFMTESDLHKEVLVGKAVIEHKPDETPLKVLRSFRAASSAITPATWSSRTSLVGS